MHVLIDRAELLKALGYVEGIVERNINVPILSHLLLKAQTDQFALTAADMDMQATGFVGAKVTSPGETTLPAQAIGEITRHAPEGAFVKILHQKRVKDSQEAEEVHVSVGRARYVLYPRLVDEFPVLEQKSFLTTFSLPGKDFKRLLEKARTVMSQEETRHYLNGIYLHPSQGRLAAVATDAHRLCYVAAPLPEEARELEGVIIPRKTVTKLYRLICEDPEQEATLSFSKNTMKFRGNKVSLLSKLIDGTFPDYQRVVPSKTKISLTLAREPLVQTIARVMAIGRDRSAPIKLNLQEKRLVLSTTTPDTGEAEEDMEIAYTGEPVQIGFNAHYLLEILQHLEGEQIHLSMNTPSTATILRGIEDKKNLYYVLMPMRV